MSIDIVEFNDLTISVRRANQLRPSTSAGMAGRLLPRASIADELCSFWIASRLSIQRWGLHLDELCTWSSFLFSYFAFGAGLRAFILIRSESVIG